MRFARGLLWAPFLIASGAPGLAGDYSSVAAFLETDGFRPSIMPAEGQPDPVQQLIARENAIVLAAPAKAERVARPAPLALTVAPYHARAETGSRLFSADERIVTAFEVSAAVRN
jgi:hypothetical protein